MKRKDYGCITLLLIKAKKLPVYYFRLNKMQKLFIEWKHFDKGGATCKRCSQTGSNLETVIKHLKDEFVSKGIDIQLKETKLPESRMTESNQVLIDGVLLEKLIPNAHVGENHCDSCSDLIDDPSGCNCRTVKHGDDVYEAIPSDLIKQAITNSLNKERKSMKIQVLGSGCATCKKLYELTQEAVKQLKLDEEVEYITDVSKIVEMGVMSSPVLAVNGQPVMVGFVPDVEQIKTVLTKSNNPEVKKSECNCGRGCC